MYSLNSEHFCLDSGVHLINRTSADSITRSVRNGISAPQGAAVRAEWLRHIVDEQGKQLLNQPLLRSEATRESYKFLLQSLFVDPRVQVRKNPSKEMRLSHWIQSSFAPKVTIAVIGRSGVGKTAALIHLYMEYATRFLSGSSSIIPMFVELRIITATRSLNGRKALNTIARHLGCGSMPTSSAPAGEQILFFLDGLDEYMALATRKELPFVGSWDIFREWHVLGTRSEAFLQLIAGTAAERYYSEIIELQEWDIEDEVKRFVHDYLQQSTTIVDQALKDFTDFLHLNRLSALATTPLAVMMLLTIWRHERERGAADTRHLNIRNRSDLFDRFVHDWIQLELAKQADEESPDLILNALKDAAWSLYHRPRGQHPLIAFDDLCRSAASRLSIDESSLLSSRAFRSLLKVRESRDPRHQELVYSFRHESLQAFLVAQVLTRALATNDPDLEETLSAVFTYEVNAFARERLTSPEAPRQAIEDHLERIYYRNLSSSRSATPDAIRVRNGAAYYLGRLLSPRLRKIYNRIGIGEIVEHPMVKGTMASGLILMNDEQGECDYLANLHSNTPDDIRTRRFHLVYYGDCPDEGPDSLLVDATAESHQDDWRRTRAALTSRLRSSDPRDLTLRAFDLCVFRRFCETRGYVRFTRDEDSAIAHATRGIQHLPAYKQRLILQEAKSLTAFISS